MNEKLNINILFAEGDNKPILKNKGWVSYFEKFLYMMLRQTVDRQFKINMVSDEQPGKYHEADLTIAILSPDFILSGVCLDRVEDLFKTTDTDAIHHQIFPVYKAPLSYVDIPDKLKVLNAYIFYIDQENQEQELSDFFGKEAEKSFWMKMVDLCFDIYESVIKMSELNQKVEQTHNRKAIYLAETGQDLSGARNIIKRELTIHGYEVYPRKILPHVITPLKQAIKEDLDKCQFSIHMVGASYGAIPSGSEISVMDLQNEMAADRAEAAPNEFNRLIWISPSLKYASEKQTAFIHNLKRDARASLGAEVLQTSLEDFKNTLWEELLEGSLNKKLRHSFSSFQEEKAVVYLISDAIDHKEVQPIIKLLEKRAVKLITLQDEGGLMELRNKHIDALKQMDAAVIYQKHVNNQWVFMKLLDLLKAPGFGRSKPILGRYFISSQVKGTESEYVKKYEVEVDSSEDLKKLDKFIERIEKAHQKSSAEVAE